MFTKKTAEEFCRANGYKLIVSPFSFFKDRFIYTFVKGRKIATLSGVKGIAYVIGNEYGTYSFENLEEALASVKAYL